MLALGIITAWVAPAFAIGMFAAARTLTPTTVEPPPVEDPTDPLTWEQIDLAEDQQSGAPPLTRPTHPTKMAPTEPPATEGPLTLHLASGLFATTATARCPDGNQHRARFEGGIARFDALPASGLCRITFQGSSLVTSLRSGPGDLHCTPATTAGALICR